MFACHRTRSSPEEYSWIEGEPYYEEMTHEELCADMFGMWTAEDLIWTYTFVFADESPLILIGVVIIAGLIMMMLGSSAIGAGFRMPSRAFKPTRS